MASKITFCALLFCFFLLFASEMQITEAKYCRKPSKGWNGKCFEKKCDNWCKNKDHEDYGDCYKGHCYCYYKC
ncbi:hypothetical protein R3W88_018731 [Solanum pinnatisectum]|uniref:Uncharacterized protein n=1 Tax=Solanum pinnatisectum TaxID=50273 RepID=A0AAV9KHJ9_9SOLN|nr:hypothetical protein R3W88_018731 [Solanum pinnatisectum]